MKHLHRYNESFFAKSRIDKTWLDNLVKKLDDIGDAKLIDYDKATFCINFDYKKVNFKILINEESKLMKSNINVSFLSNIDEVIEELSELKSRYEYEYDNDFDRGRGYRGYSMNFYDDDDKQFDKIENLTHKNYKDSISDKIILSKIKPILEKLEKMKKATDDEKLRSEHRRKLQQQREKESNERKKRIQDEFVENLPKEDLSELLVNLSDNFGTPNITLNENSYMVTVRIKNLNNRKTFFRKTSNRYVLDGDLAAPDKGVEYNMPTDNYLQLLSILNDINHKLKEFHQCELYYNFSHHTTYDNLSIKIQKV